MRKIFMLVIMLACCLTKLNSQSCLPDGIIFDTQAEVDNFHNNYPGCTSIEGTVKVAGWEVTNLDGLSGLTSIGGGLWIISTGMLNDISGLSSLTSVGSSLTIDGAQNLASLNGLANLQHVGGNLEIGNYEGNYNLHNLVGLQNLQSIGGYLLILHNMNLESIEGLNNMTSVGGDVILEQNNNLVSISGLEGLTTIPGYLRLSSLYSLQSLNGLENLTSVGGSVQIVVCHGLSGLEGLENLTSIGGKLDIGYLHLLTDLSGLDNLAFIGGDLVIEGNEIMTDLSGMPDLTSVAGSIIIQNNGSLQNMSGLESLESIGMDIKISANSLLSNLFGLNGINPASIKSLSIYDNPLLSECYAESICSYLTSPNGTVDIFNNATGCNSPFEISEACGGSLPCLPYGNYYFFSQQDVDSFQIHYPGCTELEGNVFIYGSNIASLEGLSEVTSIAGKLVIEGNDSLVDLENLNNLTDIGNALRITDCSALASLSGLDNINPLSMNSLYLLNNATLSECNINSICYFINNYGPAAYIGNNASGCNSIQQVAAACGVAGIPENDDTGILIFPNPVRSAMHIKVQLSQAQLINIEIFDIKGRKLISLVDDPLPAGENDIIWDASSLTPGTYLCRLTGDAGMEMKKVIVIK